MVRTMKRIAVAWLLAAAIGFALGVPAAGAAVPYDITGTWVPAPVAHKSGELHITMGTSGSLTGEGTLGALEIGSIGGEETPGGELVVSLQESGGNVGTAIGQLGDGGECFSGIAYDNRYSISKHYAWFVYVRSGYSAHPDLLETGAAQEPYVCAGTPEAGGAVPYSLAGGWVPASGSPGLAATWTMDGLGDVIGTGTSGGEPVVQWGHLSESGKLKLITGAPESPGYASFLSATVGDGGACVSGSSIDTRGFRESEALVLAGDVGSVPLLGSGECAGGVGATRTYVACSAFGPDTSAEYFRCTATVSDATGEEPQRTPTGTVRFAAPEGSFPAGSSCVLAEALSGQAYCTVRYEPDGASAPGASLEVSALYGGGGSFSASVAKTTASVALSSAHAPEHEVSLVAPGELCTTSLTLEPELFTEAGALVSRLDPSPVARAAARAAAHRRGAARTRRARIISYSAARKRALRILRPRSRRSDEGVVVYGQALPLPAGALLAVTHQGPEPRSSGGRRLALPLRLSRRAYLFWADLAPGARFGHPSVLLALDATTGRIASQVALDGEPLLDGRRLVFLTAPGRGDRIYSRLTATPLTPAGRARARSAYAFLARLERKAKRGRTPRHARKADTAARSQLISLVWQGSRESETFSAEGRLMHDVYSQNGVATTEIAAAGELDSAVSAAAAAGKTSVTIFIDGHGALNWTSSLLFGNVKTGELLPVAGGLTDPQVEEEVGKLALKEGPFGAGPDPEWRLHGVASVTGGTVALDEPASRGGETTNAVTSEQLAQLAEAHPEIKFNFVIVACHSGAFIAPLSTVPNVASVATSSAADQNTVGSSTLPELTSPVAPYVVAEVYALQLGFEHAGPGADVDAVDRVALESAPSYDVAALQGKESPSTPWVDVANSVSGGQGVKPCNIPTGSELDSAGQPWINFPVPEEVVLPGS